MSVDDICTLTKNIKGINPLQVPAYQNRIIDNNIGGVVLSTCDTEELREVLAMKFGDWQLFKSALIGLRQREMVNEEFEQFEPGFVKDHSKSDTAFESTSTQGGRGYSDIKYERMDKKGQQEAYSRTVKAEVSPPRMSRVDSAYQQVAFETGLLREAMINFTEDGEEEEMHNNVSFSADTKRGSLEDMDDSINSSESQPLLKRRPSSQAFSDGRRKESLGVVHETEEPEGPSAMFYLDETESAPTAESVREIGGVGIPLVTFHRGDHSNEDSV